MKRLLWWLLAGSRGGTNRVVVIRALKERPYNAHQLAEALHLDYKTVRHHLKVLAENNVVVASGKEQYGATSRAAPDAASQPYRRYGEMWFLSPSMEQHYQDFLDIMVIDQVDAALQPEIEALGLDVAVTDTIMASMEKKAALARTVLGAVGLSP